MQSGQQLGDLAAVSNSYLKLWSSSIEIRGSCLPWDLFLVGFVFPCGPTVIVSPPSDAESDSNRQKPEKQKLISEIIIS